MNSWKTSAAAPSRFNHDTAPRGGITSVRLQRLSGCRARAPPSLYIRAQRLCLSDHPAAMRRECRPLWSSSARDASPR
jgi:hypothetical protein